MRRSSIRSRLVVVPPSSSSSGCLLGSMLVFSLGSVLVGCGDQVEETQDEAQCSVPRRYGDLGERRAVAGTFASGVPSLDMTIASGWDDEDKPVRDKLTILLRPDSGAFADGVTTGRFVIRGEDSFAQTCGLCIRLLGDVSSSPVGGLAPVKFAKRYQAVSGTVILTSVERPYSGSLHDLSFELVGIGGEPLPNSLCKTEIASLSFTSD